MTLTRKSAGGRGHIALSIAAFAAA